MYISDIDKNARAAAKTSFVYLLISLFCALFGAVYELFSHEVYSFYMTYAFAFPLAGGTLPFSVLHLLRAGRYPGALARNLYHSGIATLTVGSIVQGVMEIYGTTNALAGYYWIAGGALLLDGIAAYLVQHIGKKDKKRMEHAETA